MKQLCANPGIVTVNKTSPYPQGFIMQCFLNYKISGANLFSDAVLFHHLLLLSPVCSLQEQ